MININKLYQTKKAEEFLIAGGNPTLLVWDCPISEQRKVIDKNLGIVEQVGFVDQVNSRLPMLTMMGNELCINSTIALASQLNRKGQLKTSGIEEVVEYLNTGEFTTIKINTPFVCDGNKILLSGIGFICSDKKSENLKERLKKYCIKYNFPAFGLALTDGNKLTPYVYVLKTNSIFKETACGSGSIAASIVTGQEKIIQPTGETIFVRRVDNKFTVRAKVVKINQ